MAVTRICCCSVIIWCYVMIILDMFNGALFAMKHFDVSWVKGNIREKADRSSFWGRNDKCLDLGLGTVGMAIEMSLLAISLLALVAVCCRKAFLLLPYLILKVVVICIYVYMCVQYILHFEDCKAMLIAQFLSLLFSFCAYSIVAGTYQVIKNEYISVDRRYP